jgi:hypothetical protein
MNIHYYQIRFFLFKLLHGLLFRVDSECLESFVLKIYFYQLQDIFLIIDY